MLFNSLAFLIFYPVVTAAYFLTPHRFRWIVLLVSSCYFYMFFIPKYILILLGTILVDYCAGLWIERSQGSTRKWALAMSIAANVVCLAFFKYFNFFTENANAVAHILGQESWFRTWQIVLPIGLSFHTFQAMSYTIEVYRGKQAAERHLGIFAVYVLFYPQLVAGPIERPQNLLHQFREVHAFSYENMTSGLRLMAYGWFLKAVLADRLAILVNQVYDRPDQYSGMLVALAAIAFSFQIFCDFAGYSTIAIGAARTMGFTLMKNFDRPYQAQSVAEFWRRWHISLSTWFKDYLYIPLGGNRVSRLLRWRNLMIVFLVSGLWHGANWTFVVWGGLHGLFIIIGETAAPLRDRVLRLIKISPDNPLLVVWRTVSVFALVTICWIFFRAESFAKATKIFRRITSLSISDYARIHNDLKAVQMGSFDRRVVVFGLLMVACVHWFERVNKVEFTVARFPWWIRWPAYYAVVASLCWLGIYGKEQFIYFQF